MIRCAGCGRPITSQEAEDALDWSGAKWHKSCLIVLDSPGDPAEEARLDARAPRDDGPLIPGTLRHRRNL